MTKFEFCIPSASFEILLIELESNFGEAVITPELDYHKINHPDYTLIYSTDHKTNVLVLLDIDPSWQVPAPIQSYARSR